MRHIAIARLCVGKSLRIIFVLPLLCVRVCQHVCVPIYFSHIQQNPMLLYVYCIYRRVAFLRTWRQQPTAKIVFVYTSTSITR